MNIDSWAGLLALQVAAATAHFSAAGVDGNGYAAGPDLGWQRLGRFGLERRLESQAGWPVTPSTRWARSPGPFSGFVLFP